MQFKSEEDAGLAWQRRLSWKTYQVLTGSSASGDHTWLLVHLCKYYTPKTRMPRSHSGSVSEHFSLKRLRPLFFTVPTLERPPPPPCTPRGEQSPPVVCLVSGLAVPMAPVLFPVLWDGRPEGRHSRSIPASSGKGSPTTARVCAGLAG